MKNAKEGRQAVKGERTGTVCPVCGDNVLRQERFDRPGGATSYRLVCSKRGCPWQGRV